ncbi:MAG: AbrB/MazE/SpoVT family DNA-binding domain-containing protein [Gammaproteobacteria bacterium]|nr:AbrB/MazE/SpoVT family DNA-binding domain-containing protein [Gammaproteobacteria bacterium]
MINLKIRKVGNSLGVVLPLEVTSRLHLEDGDRLFLTEAPEGGYRLTPYDPEFEAQLKLAEEGMARYRNTLHILAK